jgi:hypothetical protein
MKKVIATSSREQKSEDAAIMNIDTMEVRDDPRILKKKNLKYEHIDLEEEERQFKLLISQSLDEESIRSERQKLEIENQLMSENDNGGVRSANNYGSDFRTTGRCFMDSQGKT